MNINVYNQTKVNVHKQLTNTPKIKINTRPKVYSDNPYVMLNKKVNSNGRMV